MLFVLIGKPTEALTGGDLPLDFSETLQAEAEKTAEYRALGLLRDLWLFAGHKGALLLCEVGSIQSAHALSADYPMVRKGYITHEIHELLSVATPEQSISTAD